MEEIVTELLNDKLLWELMQKNAGHIEVLNREFGCIAEAVNWIKIFVGFQFSFMICTFVAVLRNLHWTKRNGFSRKDVKNTLAK